MKENDLAILELKSEIFDIFEQQSKLQGTINQLEEAKRVKVKELEKLRIE